MSRLVLASASPRRRDLLHDRLGLEVVVVPADVDESPRHGESPSAMVQRLARRKVSAVEVEPDDLVVAADTVVISDGEVLGKPATDERATMMLRGLSGREHSVLTGVAVKLGPQGASGVERTKVRFRRLSPSEIEGYVATGDPLDKAGGYGIQGIAGAFVEHIEGTETGVIGLPLGRLAVLVASVGANLMDYRRDAIS
ncbi:Maf family protein [Euzebya tangerina]|uniref:Maf family protein n=1 Tax=Euzebya tangerina TaxID=591198 RepID=UPI000E31C069|nr:Maf family protein [Euzebya tangerina]